MTPDLFPDDQAGQRLERMYLLFDAWVAKRDTPPPQGGKAAGALRDGSVAIYRDIWRSFANWCDDRAIDFHSIDESQLHAFLDSLGRHGDATPLYVRRVIQLIDRLDRFDSAQGDRLPNPAVAAVREHPRIVFAGDGSHEDVPEFLNARQAKVLIGALTREPDPGASRTSWQDLRNRAALGVQLGAGITPGEVLVLKVQDVVIDAGRVQGEPWALRLPASGNFLARQTPLAGWAGRLLLTWLEARARHQILGDMLFPSTRAGRSWSRNGSHKAFREELNRIGIGTTQGGTFFLRHTFALRQLTRYPDEQVALWLGIQDPKMIARYRRVLFEPVDIV